MRVVSFSISPGFSLQNDGLEAVVVVEVDVGGAENIHVAVVLDVDQLLGELALVMVVADGEHADDVLACVLPFVFHHAVADQVAHALRARIVPAFVHAVVEHGEQRLGERDGEADGGFFLRHDQSHSWVW